MRLSNEILRFSGYKLNFLDETVDNGKTERKKTWKAH